MSWLGPRHAVQIDDGETAPTHVARDSGDTTVTVLCDGGAKYQSRR